MFHESHPKVRNVPVSREVRLPTSRVLSPKCDDITYISERSAKPCGFASWSFAWRSGRSRSFTVPGMRLRCLVVTGVREREKGLLGNATVHGGCVGSERGWTWSVESYEPKMRNFVCWE